MFVVNMGLPAEGAGRVLVGFFVWSFSAGGSPQFVPVLCTVGTGVSDPLQCDFHLQTGFVPRVPSPQPRGSAHPHGRGSALQPALPSAANGSERIALRPLQYSWEYSLYCNCALYYFICFYKLGNTIMIQWYHSEPRVKKSKCSYCD